jgi:hypothetical protein
MMPGTWRQNMAKSKYHPAELTVKSSTSRFEVTQNGVKLVNDGVDGKGRATHTEYTANFDGKDYPVKATIDGKPNPDQDAVAWKKIDDLGSLDRVSQGPATYRVLCLNAARGQWQGGRRCAKVIKSRLSWRASTL